MSNAARALWLGLTRARFVKSPVSDASAEYYKHLTRFSSAFALVADIAMLMLGGQLKRKEKLSGRLADVLSYLYLGSATLKRFADQDQPAQDLPLLRWSCEYALREMQQSLDLFLINFPNKIVGRVLRTLIFPLGKTYTGPTDVLGHQAANILLQPSEARDRLTKGIFIPNEYVPNSDDALGRLEYALRCIIAAEPADHKLAGALKAGRVVGADRQAQLNNALKQEILSQDDIEVLIKADKARRAAIMVDEFDANYFSSQLMPAETHQATKECA